MTLRAANTQNLIKLHFITDMKEFVGMPEREHNATHSISATKIRKDMGLE